jgi:hypothetical protein
MNQEEPKSAIFYLVLFCIALVAIVVKIILYVIHVQEFKY